MCLRCSVWACGSLINPQSFCLYLMHAVWKKSLERHSIIYASRYLNTAIAYKLQTVFQYSVSLQYNCFDTVFTTMYFNTAQLCLWPWHSLDSQGEYVPYWCTRLLGFRSSLPSLVPYHYKFLLWVATRGRERIKYCLSSLGSDYKACTNHVLLDSV